MRFADSEGSMARATSEHPAAAVRGQDPSCMKGVSCGVGGENCHVTVMRDHVGTY